MKYVLEEFERNKINRCNMHCQKETAEIIGEELKLPIKIDANLREQNKGVLTGKLKASLSKEESNLLNNQQIDTVFEEGESLQDLYSRVKNYLKEMSKYEDNSLVVTHRGVINVFYYLFNSIPLDMKKKRFNVDHLSIHELDIQKKLIRRIK